MLSIYFRPYVNHILRPLLAFLPSNTHPKHLSFLAFILGLGCIFTLSFAPPSSPSASSTSSSGGPTTPSLSSLAPPHPQSFSTILASLPQLLVPLPAILYLLHHILSHLSHLLAVQQRHKSPSRVRSSHKDTPRPKNDCQNEYDRRTSLTNFHIRLCRTLIAALLPIYILMGRGFNISTADAGRAVLGDWMAVCLLEAVSFVDAVVQLYVDVAVSVAEASSAAGGKDEEDGELGDTEGLRRGAGPEVLVAEFEIGILLGAMILWPGTIGVLAWVAVGGVCAALGQRVWWVGQVGRRMDGV